MAESDDQTTSSMLHLAIIGGGIAGCEAAAWASARNTRVSLINSGLPLGGSCIHTGALPARLLMSAATDLRHSASPRFAGLTKGDPSLDWLALRKARRQLSDHFADLYRRQLAACPNVEIVDAHARFLDASTLEVGRRALSFDRALLTPGSEPVVPEIEGIDAISALSMGELMERDELPAKLIFLEIDNVALGLAQALARLGIEVTMITKRRRLLEDHHCRDVDAALSRILSRDGVTLEVDTTLQRVEAHNTGLRAYGLRRGETHQWDAQALVIVDHRRPRMQRLAPQEGGVELTDEGFIIVDETLQTTNKNVFAAGDAVVRGHHAFASAYDAVLAARNAVEPSRMAGHNRVVPFAIYTDPPLAGVGWDEGRAARAGFDTDTAIFSLEELPAAHALGSREGFVKLVRDRRSNHLVGARVIAPHAAELIMELALSIRYGLTVDELSTAVHPPISLGDAIARAARRFPR